MTEQTPKTPVEPKPAATIILLCDGSEGLEVLILEKAGGSHFAAGALVFPGGKVSDEDVDFLESGDEAGVPLQTLKIAAVREMHEECGILLARQPGDAEVMAAAEVPDLGQSETVLQVAKARGLSLATDTLVFFAHWITPPTRTKRFDTHFFIAPAPAGQAEPAPDAYEIVKADWRRPADILAEAEAGHVKLVLPTLMNLTKLARWANVEEALTATRAAEVVTVQPQLVETDAGQFRKIPEEAGYGVSLIPVEKFRSA